VNDRQISILPEDAKPPPVKAKTRSKLIHLWYLDRGVEIAVYHRNGPARTGALLTYHVARVRCRRCLSQAASFPQLANAAAAAGRASEKAGTK